MAARTSDASEKAQGSTRTAIRTTDSFGFGTGYQVTQDRPHLSAGSAAGIRLPRRAEARRLPAEVRAPDSARRHARAIQEEPAFRQEMVEHPPLRSLYGDYDYSKGQQWAMVIDLNSCVAATPAPSLARPRTTSAWSARSRLLAAARCTGFASTGTIPVAAEEPQAVNGSLFPACSAKRRLAKTSARSRPPFTAPRA
jgi:hypothetical protein